MQMKYLELLVSHHFIEIITKISLNFRLTSNVFCTVLEIFFTPNKAKLDTNEKLVFVPLHIEF